MMSPSSTRSELSRHRLAERVSAASYGTVLIIAALLVIEADDVSSGWGWELVTGVGVATWVAHMFAEVLGNHVSNPAAHERHEVRAALIDGLPILLATVLPAVALGLGSLGILDPRPAFWVAVIVALFQLIGLGAFVGAVAPTEGSSQWRYAAITAAVGFGVVVFLVALGH